MFRRDLVRAYGAAVLLAILAGSAVAQRPPTTSETVVKQDGARQGPSEGVQPSTGQKLEKGSADDRKAREGDIARSIQKELARLGCSPGDTDGSWGPKSGRALAEAVRKLGQRSDSPTEATLRVLEKESGRLCPCPDDQREISGRCVTLAPGAPAAVPRAAAPPLRPVPRKEVVPTPKKETASAPKEARPSKSRSRPGVGGTCPGFYGLPSGASCVDAGGRTCFAVGGSRHCV